MNMYGRPSLGAPSRGLEIKRTRGAHGGTPVQVPVEDAEYAEGKRGDFC